MASQPTPSQEVDVAMDGLLKTTLELKLELQQTALELASILLEKGQRAQERVHAGLLNSALTGDFEQLQMSIEKLTEHIDFVEDVAKLVRHVTWTEASQVRAKHAQINLHIYGPQVYCYTNDYNELIDKTVAFNRWLWQLQPYVKILIPKWPKTTLKPFVGCGNFC